MPFHDHYRDAFQKAGADKGAAQYLFHRLLETYDAQLQNLNTITGDFGKPGTDFSAVMQRVHEQSYSGMRDFQAISRQIDAAAKNDPRVETTRRDLSETLMRELKKTLPQPMTPDR